MHKTLHGVYNDNYFLFPISYMYKQITALLFSVEETDISELEKKYWILKAQSKTGKFDQETFKSFVCPTLPESLCEGIT